MYEKAQYMRMAKLARQIQEECKSFDEENMEAGKERLAWYVEETLRDSEPTEWEKVETSGESWGIFCCTN